MTVHAWKILGVLVFLFLCSRDVIADDFKMLSKFGNWSLSSSQNEKFLAVQELTNRLAVTCSDGMRTYIVYLKVIDPESVSWDDGRKAGYFRFTAWADAGAPRDFQFLVGPEQPHMAQVLVSLNPEITGANQDFWRLLKSARTNFSYSTAAATFSFDTTDLQSALQRFEDVCAKIIPAPYKPPAENPGSGFWFGR
jgi:hypothetical protein